MVARFFDSSAIVAAYAGQPNHAHARALLGAADITVSRLAEVETVSGLARLAREASLPAARRDAGIAAFLADFETWSVIEVTPEVTRDARGLLVRHSLRASDAIQLASGLALRAGLAQDLDAFVAFDRRLADAARRERLTVIDC